MSGERTLVLVNRFADAERAADGLVPPASRIACMTSGCVNVPRRHLGFREAAREVGAMGERWSV
jgi:hypothetical protein